MEMDELLGDMSSVDLTYVVDGGSVFNKEGGLLLASCRIVAQNNYITLELSKTGDEKDEIVLTSDDLRGLADKLNQWADLSDKTCEVGIEDEGI